MKLGIKHLYIDKEIKFVKGRAEVEDYSVFFSTKFNVSKYPQFYARCYRLFTIMKDMDPGLYENLASKSVEPPVLFL